MIETNISKTPEVLELSQIFNPFASESGKSDKEKNESKSENEKYPYFIESIPYPEEVLNNKSYSNILKIFFNKNVFYKTIVEPYVHLKTTDPDVKIIEKNIMIMLNLIFPTSYPSSNNINTSYNKYLLKTPYELKFDLGELTQGLTIPGFANNSKAEYSYLKKNGTTYTVSEIIWLNDIFNEPEYKKLVDELIKYNTWVDDIKFDVNTEQKELITTFVNGLQYNESITEKLAAGEKNVKSIRINDREIYLIKRQKKMFSSIDLNTEIDNIWNYFIVETNETKGALTELKKHLSGKTSDRIATFTSNLDKKKIFDAKENFTFKNSADLDKNNIEAIIDKINMMNPIDVDMKSNAAKTEKMNDNNKAIFIEFLFKPFYKYITASLIEQSNNPRSFNENTKYDSNINDLIKNIENLNKINFNIEKDVDLTPDKNLYKNITESINIIENIQKLFGKIEFYKSNEYTILSNKINQMILLSTEIRKFILINEYVLQKEKGICVNYEKLIENKEDQKILSEELKQSKYAPFNNIVSTINAFYTTRKSMNPDIQIFMDDYFNCKNSKFNDEVISNIEKLANNQKIDKNNLKKWNVSVTLCSDDKNTSNKYYEIFVYMDVIEGELNSSNTSSVSCSFLDEKLSEMFKKLTSNQDNNYNVPRSDKMLTVSDFTKKETPTEQAPTETSSDQPELSSDNQPQPLETKGGKHHRESRKNKRNKKMRKTKRYRRI